MYRIHALQVNQNFNDVDSNWNPHFLQNRCRYFRCFFLDVYLTLVFLLLISCRGRSDANLLHYTCLISRPFIIYLYMGIPFREIIGKIAHIILFFPVGTLIVEFQNICISGRVSFDNQ